MEPKFRPFKWKFPPPPFSQEKAKERPRLLESLAGAGTVVFRVQGAVRRVGLFREVARGGGGAVRGERLKLATCPRLSSSLMSSQLMRSGFQGPIERIGKGIGGPRGGLP